MKILTKTPLLLVAIAGSYFLLAQINWTGIFQVQENGKKMEKKLGSMIMNHIYGTYEVLDGEDSIMTTLDSICLPILSKNDIDSTNYSFHIIVDEEVNAFALPDDQILVTTGLIDFLDSAEFLSGIIAHEIAHCEKNHVMKSLVTNFGLDLLLSSTGTAEVTNFLTGQAFSRSLEKEADETAVEYLNAADIDPKNLSRVMELFEIHMAEDIDLTWISTHPAPADRKAYIKNRIKRLNPKASTYQKALDPSTWTKFQDQVRY